MRLHSRIRQQAMPGFAAALLALTLLAAPAAAKQTLTVRDGGQALAKLSAKEPTRIALAQGMIDELIGDLRTEKNPCGRLIHEATADRSEVFLSLARDGAAGGCPPQEPGKAMTLFVKSEGRTFTLLLQPVDMPADQVLLAVEDATQAASNAGAASYGNAASGADAASVIQAARRAPRSAQESAGGSGLSNASYYRAIKALWIAMAGGVVPPQIEVRPVERDVALWREAKMTLKQLYFARQWVGERYELSNVSAAPMVLREYELDREDVAFVSIRTHQLAPGQSTAVYVVRNRTEADR
jgi:conjugal transfer pilus assembly protein TraK